MCGIAGIAGGERLPDDAEATVRAMCARLSHRGPDADGLHSDIEAGAVLGHRRLTIIDLSDAGLQPMSSPDGRYAITFNGEIYNYRELRSELERDGARFRSASDTEVLLAAWARWGRAALARLRGMFAFAVWDVRERTLFAARDAIGIKPLFWARLPGGAIAFGSEIKALLAVQGVDTAPDDGALADYLTYGYVPHPRTAYRGIRALPPGSLLEVRDGRHRIEEYWDAAYPSAVADRAAEDVRAELADAVRSQLVADVPVGVLLSSGIDSSTVATLAAEAQPGLLSFTMSIGEGDRSEAADARAMAERLGFEHHEETASAAIGDDAVDRVLDVYDEPFADSSALPTLTLSHLARRHVKVAVSGDGGDEVFAGYARYHKFVRTQALAQRTPFPRAAFVAAAAVLPSSTRGWRAARLLAHEDVDRYAAMTALFAPDLRGRIAGPRIGSDDPLWALRRYWRPELEPVSRCAYADLRGYLPDDILTKVDRASMDASLEVRPPLLDAPLVESVTALPERARFRPGEQKTLLRAALDGSVPESVFTKPKQGFSLPLDGWLQARSRDGGLLERLRKGPVCTEGYVRADRVDLLAKAPYSGHHLWAVLVLDAWLRRQ